MGPMIERIPNGGRNGSGVGEELFVIAGVAGNKSLGHPIRAHGPPFVMIAVMAISEPDLSQIGKSPVLRNIRGRDVTMIVEKGHFLRNLEVQLFARGGREQKILG